MREGVRQPQGLPLAARDLFGQWGQEFGHWVRFSCGSDQPPPRNCLLSVVGGGVGVPGLCSPGMAPA